VPKISLGKLLCAQPSAGDHSEYNVRLLMGYRLLSIITWKLIQKPRLKLRLRKTAPTAVALHRQMYTALAE